MSVLFIFVTDIFYTRHYSPLALACVLEPGSSMILITIFCYTLPSVGAIVCSAFKIQMLRKTLIYDTNYQTRIAGIPEYHDPHYKGASKAIR